jgi:plasmid stabilization system protein ParE
MKLHWTQEAVGRLEAIKAYIAEHNKNAADAEIKRIILRAYQLVELPQLGREVPEYENPVIREILERPYRIIYRSREDIIEILSVMHYRQLLPDDLQEFVKGQPQRKK